MIRLILLLFMLCAPLAHAAEGAAVPRGSVIIVDVKRILDESKAAIGSQKKIEEQRSAFQEEIAAQEKNIREAEQELLAQRGKIDAKEYSQKEDQLRQKFRDVERYVQERRQALEKATSLSMGKVHDVLLDIVKDIARKRGVQAVLVKQEVLWSEPILDVTDMVLERLNTELPDVPVNVDLSAGRKDKAK